MSADSKYQQGADVMNRYALHQRQATLTAVESLAELGYDKTTIINYIVAAIGSEIAGAAAICGTDLLSGENWQITVNILHERIACQARARMPAPTNDAPGRLQ